MGTQQFCLKWNNHQTNMLTVFDQLLSSEALVDVTLACEGLSLKAHKMVLSACSPFFQSLFLENPCKHPIVIMKDMKYTDLKAIVDFMYRGEVNVSQDQLSALLKTAETLKVKGLAEVTGDNRHGGPGGLVQQEIIQQHLVNTPQSLPASGAQTQHRAESPPLSRRKRGRPRRRSLSGSNRSDSEDQVPSKIKEPDSPEVIEEVTSEVESTNDARQRLAPSGHPQSQVSSLHSVHHGVPPLKSHGALPSQQDTHMSVEEPSGDEGDYDVEPSKLMEQTMTTENVPVFTDGPSQGPTLPPASTQLAIPTTVGLADTQPLHTGPGPCDSQALVPCSMPSEPSTSSCVSQDNNQDIKPGALVSFEEPPISPVAGPSHQDSSNSMMMYMDTSGVPAIPGPSSYQLDKQPSQPPQQQQPQEVKIEKIDSDNLECENKCILSVKIKIEKNDDDNLEVENKYNLPEEKTSECETPRENQNTEFPSKKPKIYKSNMLVNCNICEKRLKKSSLAKHMTIHTRQNSSSDASHKSSIEDHILVNSGEKTFQCNICNYKRAEKSQVIDHIRTHTGEKPYSCDVCLKKFSRSSYLNNHKSTHSKKKPLQCDICKYKCSDLRNLKRHSQIHAGEKPFSCDVCHKNFSHKVYLRKHRALHSEEKPFKCDICQQKYSLKENLAKHCKSHLDREHLKYAHSEEERFSCNICDEKFKQKWQLNKHRLSHSETMPSECNENENLVKHGKTDLAGEQLSSCNISDKKFKQSQLHEEEFTNSEAMLFESRENENLVKHDKDQTGELRFSCNICDKKFTNLGRFNRHKLIHCREKPFQCNLCEHKTCRKDNLKKHMETHAKEKSFSCDICHQNFVNIRCLNSHKLIHSGEKLFQCGFCKYISCTKEDVRSHLLTHTE